MNMASPNEKKKPKQPSLALLQFLGSFPDERKLLANDVKQNRKTLEWHNTATNRRNYIRSLFALFEIEESALRTKAWESIKDLRPRLDENTIERVCLLSNEEYRIQPNGNVHQMKRRVGFLNSLAYSIKTLKALYNCQQDFLGGQGWEAMQKAKEIRDRITHPHERSVEIEEEDLENFEKAAEWLEWVKESFKTNCLRLENQ